MSTGRLRRATAVALAALLLGSAFALSSGQPAAADHGCIVAPWPAFGRVAQTAKRIIVGTVTESLRDDSDIQGIANILAYPMTDPSHSFRLRVDEVLRGSAPGSITIERLRSGLPRQDPRRECGLLSAKVGDRLAIAFGGILPRAKRRIDTVVWIEGDPRISGQPAKRLTLERVRQLAGHAPDGSTLPDDRGIRRPAGSLSSLPIMASSAAADILRTMGDVQARGECSRPGQRPGVEVDGPATLVAAYRMGGQELAAYAERLWSLGPLVEHASDGYAIPLDVCIFDGSFTSARSGRMLVLIGDADPPSWGVAVCDKNEIPLDYDRPDPSPWPQPTETWC